jgi:hypothetical protein
MVNSFIEIRKADLKRELSKMNIRWKHQDKICDIVKLNINLALPDIIAAATTDIKKVGNHTLKEFYKNPDKIKNERKWEAGHNGNR